MTQATLETNKQLCRDYFKAFRVPRHEAAAAGLRCRGREGAGAPARAGHAHGTVRQHEAAGKKIDIAVLDLFQIRDGRLVEHWALLDNLGMLKQLGAIAA
jgi:SnoaL-like polyketide cyclase